MPVEDDPAFPRWSAAWESLREATDRLRDALPHEREAAQRDVARAQAEYNAATDEIEPKIKP
jgi:hypothetical protein